jgi:hypothetical protein
LLERPRGTLAGTDGLEAAVRSLASGKVGQFGRPLRYAVTALADLNKSWARLPF